MFGRKDAEDQATPATDDNAPMVPTPQSSRVSSPAITPRRVVDIPHSTGRRPSSASDGAERKLTVGKGLSLAGEIASCDILVVEGKIEAKLTDGKLLEIAESGQFRGSVEIENADIAGRYDGQLVVHGRLTVRSTGRISGTVKYGELEVNAGGQIIGEIQVAGGGAGAQQQTGPGAFRPAAKFAAPSTPDDDDDTRRPDRKTA
ncbi:MAG: polymer-forming cytoskeletal protein [Pseudomonadota bacterium]|nr:polymer-forming cytoskeletal protein [Pseudomonadota bacterium]